MWRECKLRAQDDVWHYDRLMATMLDKTLKRELQVGDDHYMLTISPEGLKLVVKGKRNGVELQWVDLVSGQAALAVALNASLDKFAAKKTRAAAAGAEPSTSPPGSAKKSRATAPKDKRSPGSTSPQRQRPNRS